MNEKDHLLTINNNHGPIIQSRKQTSQRSLYSDNQLQISPKITKKNTYQQKIKSKSKNQIPNQSFPQSPKKSKALNPVIQTSRRQSQNRYQNYQQNNNSSNINNNQQQKQPQVKQFKRSSKLIMSQNATQFRHQYKNYKNIQNNMMDFLDQTNNQKQSPKLLLKFQEKSKLKSKNSIFDQISKDSANATLSNFNQLHSLDFTKLNTQDIKNRSLRSSQGGRWLRSQSLMQQNQKKTTIHQSLIKNYHKHQSKYFQKLQKYLNIFMEFEQKLLAQPFEISLLHPLQDIKVKMQFYMQKVVLLENLPIDKPTFEWSQGQLTKFFTNYEPIFLSPQSIDSATQTLTLKKYKNCVYFGHMSNGRKQGDGIIYYFNGKIYQGKFLNDQKVYGFEMEEQQNQIYVGSFEKGIKHGIGIIKNNQYLLWGKFYNGQFEALEEQTYSTKIKQEEQSKFGMTAGTFTSNNRVKIYKKSKIQNRQGLKLSFNSLIVYHQSTKILKNSSNDLYIGDFNEQTNQRHGQGLQIFPNEDLYIGHYERNTPQNYGQYYWSSGAYYRGQFMSGMRHGKGKWHMLHGDLYEGEYMNDKKNGKGVYLWKNGAKYTGSFENDYRHGYGQMMWNDGRVYKGEWINSIQKNVNIKLDKGIDSRVVKNPGATITLNTNNKKTIDIRKSFLPGVTKKTLRSTSNPNTKQSFHSIDSSHPISKKIAIQNIKALYNPSNI